MTGQTNAVKLDEQFTADGTSYIRRPYSFFHGALGHRAPCAELIIAGKIFSLSCSRSRECRYTYKRFSAELGVSRSTVARSIRSLKEQGIETLQGAGKKMEQGDGASFQSSAPLFVTEWIQGAQAPQGKIRGGHPRTVPLKDRRNTDGNS